MPNDQIPSLLSLSPDLRLQFVANGQDKEIQGLADAFGESLPTGLLYLADHPQLRKLSGEVHFWYELAAHFMKQAATVADQDLASPGLSQQELDQWVSRCPPMTGGEYFTVDALHLIWSRLQLNWAEAIEASGLYGRKFLQAKHPLWSDVGRIHFHIAENRKDPDRPFAFLATYSARVSEKARLQHMPLGVALKDSIDRSNADELQNLLRPIERAASKSAFLQKSLLSKDLFRALFLTPNETFAVLQEIPIFENAGIICKVPDFWRGKHPPTPQLSFSIGKKKPSHVGFDGLVDFNVEIVLGDHKLSEAEIQALLRAQSHLVQLNGQWVEVDQNKLNHLMTTWREAERMSRDEGISLGGALRLLSGLQLNGELGATQGKDDFFVDRQLIHVSGGEELKKLLGQLRSPEIDPQIDAILSKDLLADLRPYQKSGVKWLNLLSQLGIGGCLADDMGLGKTIQIISLLLLFKNSGAKQRPSLLVVPASLIGNWRAEVRKFAPNLKISILHPSIQEVDQRFSFAKPDQLASDLYITTYSMIHRIDWLRETQWRCAIADEAQAIKNFQTRQSKMVRSLKADVKFALTGTPVENNLGDLWSIFDFCCHGLLGNHNEFKNLIGKLETTEPPDYSRLRDLITPYLLRRRKTDKSVISDLPEKIEVNEFCNLTVKQVKLYQRQVEILAERLEEAEGIGRSGLILTTLMKLKQICNHPSQCLADNQYDAKDSGKFAKLRELAEVIASRQEKILVFTQFREITDVLHHLLGEVFGRSGLILHGSTDIKARQNLVDQFQREDGPPFFVLSLKAGGTGLNLTRAQHVVHFDRWWNPAVENQATDRAFRIGQKNNVLVHKFICRGTVEDKIDELIRSKRALSDAIIESDSEVNVTKLSNEELLDLIQLDLNTISVE